MTFQYNIDETDFLTFQLYTASKSKNIKKRRLKNKIIVPIFYLAIGLFFFYLNNLLIAILFTLFAFAWYLLYPKWEKHFYVRHYKKFIQENYKERLGRLVAIEFNNESIIAKDNGSESKIILTELEAFNEIPQAIYVKIKTGQSFIIPKSKIFKIDEIRLEIKTLASKLEIPYNDENDWEWK